MTCSRGQPIFNRKRGLCKKCYERDYNARQYWKLKDLPCTNCGDFAKGKAKLSCGLCGACYFHKQKYGVERPSRVWGRKPNQCQTWLKSKGQTA